MNRDKLIRFFEELRKRLIIITVTVFIFAIAAFAFSDYIRHILLLPGQDLFIGLDTGESGLQLIFLTPSEALLANLRLAFITSAAVTLPVILYQLVALAMLATGRGRKSTITLTLVMYLLFAIGSSFAYFVVFPFALNFFVGFSAEDLVPTFSIARYVSFAATFIFSFALVFQLPVVFWFLGSVGILNTAFLRRNRKFALLIIIIFSAVLTPPDIFSQLLMVGPLMLLYELGILMVYLSARSREKAALELQGSLEPGNDSGEGALTGSEGQSPSGS